MTKKDYNKVAKNVSDTLSHLPCHLRLSLGYLSLTEIFENRSRNFLKQLSRLGNFTLERLKELYTQRMSN